jgi:hypothetical protein
MNTSNKMAQLSFKLQGNICLIALEDIITVTTHVHQLSSQLFQHQAPKINHAL